MGKVARICVIHLNTDPEATEIAKPISVAHIPTASVPSAHSSGHSSNQIGTTHWTPLSSLRHTNE
jgi:hypothetical protein